MNSPRLVAILWVWLAACGREVEPKTATSTARLQANDGLAECVDRTCPEGLHCVRYRLWDGDTERCVTPEQVCLVLECAEGEQCFAFTSNPMIVTCTVVTPGP